MCVLMFKARYPGKCVCGCGGGFAPGVTIMGTRGNYRIATHVRREERVSSGAGRYDPPDSKKYEQQKLF
jgi:hypothetical protein